MKKLLTAIFVFLSLFTLGLSLEVKAETATVYELVKDINNLKVDDTIIIVDSGINCALSTTQNTNNRGKVDVTKDDEGRVLANDSIQEIILKAGTKDNTFAFYVTYGSDTGTKTGYLYAVSSSANNLKTQDKLIDDSSWSISITSEGIATIKAQGEKTHNLLRYNSTSSLFSCYEKGQKDVSIMKKKTIEVSSYNITFDANGGAFADGKGTPIEASIGTDTEVTLPTSADLTKTLYETETKYTTLKGWKVGTTTYEPGEKVTVSSNTTFTAEYETTEAINSVISVTEALKICQLTGSKNTIFDFKVSGKINEIGTEYSEQYKNITVTITDGTNNLMLFRLSGGADLSVGDEIIATGKLKKYNSTSEMDAGCTYVISSKVECANFIKTVTKSSLIVSYDEELNPTNVDLRLGGKITDDSYLSGATYGVLVKEGSVVLTAGKTTYATVEEFIAANQGFKNVTCSPVQVNESGVEDANGTYYQFAWVLTDMEGHYDTTLTAVMYMIYDGTLYICNAKTTSVLDTVAQYLDPENNFEFTEEQKTVLNNIKA